MADGVRSVVLAVGAISESARAILKHYDVRAYDLPGDVGSPAYFLAGERYKLYRRVVEEENLRKRDLSKGPRTLDIDIIFFGREIIRRNNLEIPHPRFSKRRFVLEPLAEIAPEFVDPVSGKTILQLLKEVSDSGQVQRLR